MGTCTDNAGNEADSATFSNIDIDKDAPIVGTASAIKLNADGTSAGSYTAGDWSIKAVKVSWGCTDALSGPVNASDSQTVTSEGANGSVTPSCADNATTNAESRPTIVATGIAHENSSAAIERLARHQVAAQGSVVAYIRDR